MARAGLPEKFQEARNRESQRYPDVCGCHSFKSDFRLDIHVIALPKG